MKILNLSTVPDDLVMVGHITGAFGLQGWVKIKPYSMTADALMSAQIFWLEKPNLFAKKNEEAAQKTPADATIKAIQCVNAKIQGDEIVARFEGVEDRNGAEPFKGYSVSISRSLFPPLPEGEFYWVDLLGLQVINLQGEDLGVVRGMMDNGAQSILRVASSDVPENELIQCEKLIPFVEHFVKEVNVQEKNIQVDWGLDY